MITAFEVYLVMQLDRISNGLTGLIAAFIILAVILALFGAMVRDMHTEGTDTYETGKKMHQAIPKIGASLVVLIGVNALLPSSKTAAAMILLPAITSKEVIEPIAGEAKELYGLAKQALKDMVNEGKEPENKK